MTNRLFTFFFLSAIVVAIDMAPPLIANTNGLSKDETQIEQIDQDDVSLQVRRLAMADRMTNISVGLMMDGVGRLVMLWQIEVMLNIVLVQIPINGKLRSGTNPCRSKESQIMRHMVRSLMF